jgi:hypothetical protein
LVLAKIIALIADEIVTRWPWGRADHQFRRRPGLPAGGLAAGNEPIAMGALRQPGDAVPWSADARGTAVLSGAALHAAADRAGRAAEDGLLTGRSAEPTVASRRWARACAVDRDV